MCKAFSKFAYKQKRKSIEMLSINMCFVYHLMQTSTNVKAFLARTEEIVSTVSTLTRVAVRRDTTERTVRMVGIVNTPTFNYRILANLLSCKHCRRCRHDIHIIM